MAAVVSREAPVWAIQRAQSYEAKLMDQSSLIPFEDLSPYDQRRQKGRWLAYTFTLDDPKRTYVYQAAVSLVRQHSQAVNKNSYHHADLGAGNGHNTIKTARALSERKSYGPIVHYLVEQSGAALNEARKYFNLNGFENELSQIKTKFIQRDIADTDLPDRSMDAVTIVNVWHHLPTWEKLMASAGEIDRILRPGGLFVVIDTRPLPPTGFKRKIIERKIRGAVRFEKFLERAKREGLQVGDAEAEGMKDFCEYDAFKAFENALTEDQFQETIRKSALAPSLQRMGDLRSPHPFLKLVYPPLNIATGIKR